jgi:hypothetical protein
MKIILIFVLIITMTLLITTYSSDKQFEQLQVLAQLINKGSNNTNSSSINKKTSNPSSASPGQTISTGG